jgi:hypothetical protein
VVEVPLQFQRPTKGSFLTILSLHAAKASTHARDRTRRVILPVPVAKCLGEDRISGAAKPDARTEAHP